MRKRLFLFALLLLSVAIARSAFAEQYYSFSSHECAVTNLAYGEVLSFNTFDKDSGGYYCADYGNNGLTLCSGDLEALSPKGLRFKGWYTKTAGWGSSGWPSVSDCSDQITDKPKITEATILSKAGEVNGLSVVFAKYIPVYDITASVSPDGSGTVSVSPAQGPYEEGSEVTLSATESNAAYKLAYWKKGTDKVSGSDGRLSLKITATEDAEYVAVFTLKPVVTFDANGGTTPKPESKVVTAGEKYGSLATCSRTGYAFDGWWTEKAGGTPIDPETVVENPAAHTLYAHWTANSYTVKFNSNGGTETMQDQVFTYDIAQSLPANSFKRTGHTFAGWNTTSKGTGTAYGDQATVSNLTATAGGTVYLYAQWQANTYFVRFEKNGGEGTMADQAFTYSQGQNLHSNRFTRGGYVFRGWCVSQSGTGTTYSDGAYVNDLTAENNSIVPLYAQWAGRAFTVTFDANGGGSPSPSSKSVNYASTYGTLAKCSWTGHSFVGWWTERVGGSQVTETTTVKLDTDQTLYAHWEAAKYDIHFMPGGGTGTMADQVGIEYGTEVLLSSNAFTKGIQRFKRWQGSDGKFYADGATVSNLLDTAGVHTNTATWRNDFLVAFDGNGATNTVMAAQLIDKDELPQTLKANEYRRPGYTFLGWDDAAAKTRYVEPVTVTRALADVGATNTLKAAWSTNSYAVAFFGNGGLGEMEPQPFTYDVRQALRANTFVRSGYKFLGWARDPQSAAVEFADQATVSNLTSAADGVVSLFAKWSSTGSLTNPYSIAADCDKTDNAGVKLTLTPDKAAWCTVVSNASDAVEGGNDQYVKLMPTPDGTGGDVWMKGELSGSGKLSFYYRTKSKYQDDDENHFRFFVDGKEVIHEKNTVNTWQLFATNLVAEMTQVEWNFHVGSNGGWLDGDYAFVDFIKWDPQPREALTVGVTFRLNDGTSAPDDIFTNITCEAGKAIGQLPVPASEGRAFLGWMTTPDGSETIDAAWIVPSDEDGTQLHAKWSSGGEPTPGKPVAVATAGVTDGVFALTISAESGVDYGVWTNADLTVDSWGLMGEPQTGKGNPLEFKWTILPEFPQLFFRAHEVEYK